MNNIQSDDLAIGLLDLAQFHKEVPEARFGNDGVGSENAHAVEFGRWVKVGGKMAANDLVLSEATCTVACQSIARARLVDS